TLTTTTHFYSSHSTSNPPSFPTRRSSDLAAAHGRPRGAGRRAPRTVPRRPPPRGRPRRRHHVHGAAVVVAARRPAHPEQVAEQLDRKGTRLDSSHPVISYAVLCLEKKTNH